MGVLVDLAGPRAVAVLVGVLVDVRAGVRRGRAHVAGRFVHGRGRRSWPATTKATIAVATTANAVQSRGRQRPAAHRAELAVEAAGLHRRVDALAALVRAEEERADHPAHDPGPPANAAAAATLDDR